MNKKIKRLVAVALTISAFSAIAPASNINFMTTKAYASDSKSELTSLKVKGSGTIKLYESSKYKSSEKISDDDLEEGETYYGKSTSDSIKITTSDDDYVRIFKGSKGYADGKSIPLSSGTTTLKVRLYDEKTSSSTDKDDDYVAEYTLKIKYTGDDDDDDDDEDYDDIYLDDLVLTADGDEIDFNFKKKTSSYDINVKESISSIKVKAEPEDDDYKVKINGSTVDEDDKYRKTIDLDKGKNEIKVKITDDGDERVYTLNVTRGSNSSNSNSDSSNNNTNNSTTNTAKYNQWVTVNGNWQYNDAAGNPLKNTWFYDRNSGQTYFLDASGNMSTGWLYNNGAWYYLNPYSDGTRGAKLTGWQSVGGTWYYLDSTGKMITGWFKDMNGKWYYLQSSGAMAKNTTIGGYKLGSDGAWIK